MAKFEILKRKNGEFHFNLKAGNGKIILTSESYSKKDSCKHGIESVRKNSLQDERFEKKTSSSGKMYFTIKATNGQILGTSEMYESESGRENGIESVKRNAPIADITDHTLE